MGAQKTDDRREKLCFGEIFLQKTIFLEKKFDRFGINYQKGYTRMMMGIKNISKNFFLRKSFFMKIIWIESFLVVEQNATVKWRKTFFRVCFFRLRKIDSWKKFYEMFGNFTNVVTQEYWEKIFVSEELLPMKTFFHDSFLIDLVISGGTNDRW